MTEIPTIVYIYFDFILGLFKFILVFFAMFIPIYTLFSAFLRFKL